MFSPLYKIIVFIFIPAKIIAQLLYFVYSYMHKMIHSKYLLNTPIFLSMNK